MITLLKYPSDQAKKQRLYRAVNSAVYAGAVKKDASVVLEMETAHAEKFKTYCEEYGGEVELIEIQVQGAPRLQRVVALQSEILLWLAQNRKPTLLSVIEELGLTETEIQEVLRA